MTRAEMGKAVAKTVGEFPSTRDAHIFLDRARLILTIKSRTRRRLSFVITLYRVVMGEWKKPWDLPTTDQIWRMLFATEEQLAEAYLRNEGVWKDS